MYTEPVEGKFSYRNIRSVLYMIAVGVVGLAVAVLSFPTVLAINLERGQKTVNTALPDQFPVTVNPKNKTIIEDSGVNALFEDPNSPLQATVIRNADIVERIFTWIAASIAAAPWYQSIGAVNGRFVTIQPGMRKEQVAHAFGNALGWNTSQRKEFLAKGAYSSLPFAEGSFSPGTYLVETRTAPAVAQSLVNDRFSREILARYGTSTAAIVPITQALTIASLIEREAAGPEDMRYVSGIIWNRLFLNMNLQIDATLQYAKANTTGRTASWPKIVPDDRFIKSAYNSYRNQGLPPAPIANTSIASVLAALNPKKTSCLFYFHDTIGQFHCSDTYAEHVALLKKFFGRGK